MRRSISAIGGGLVFAASLAYFGWRYLIGFDSPPAGSGGLAPTAINIGLFTAFALHHSAFARTGLKTLVARVVSPELERSVYVWIASVLFIVVCAAWQPVEGVVWTLTGAPAWGLRGLQLGAGILTVFTARHLDILDLAGVRQALRLPPSRPMKLDDHGPYGIVRHPIYLCWLFLVWPAPVMNGTRLVFAVVSTLYLIAAIPFEERDLKRTFGAAYDLYSSRVRYKIVPGLY